jgi:hypothetical protein
VYLYFYQLSSIMQTAKEVQSAHVHSDRIQSLSFNKEKCFAVTASRDHTAKVQFARITGFICLMEVIVGCSY